MLEFPVEVFDSDQWATKCSHYLRVTQDQTLQFGKFVFVSVTLALTSSQSCPLSEAN